MRTWLLEVLWLSPLLVKIYCRLQAVSTESDLEETANGVNKIMQITFHSYSELVSVISLGGVNQFLLNDFKSHLLKRAFHTKAFSIQQEDVENIPARTRHQKRSVLVLIEKSNDFEEIYSKMEAQILNGHCIIVCLNKLSTLELEKIFKCLWKNQVYNVATVTRDNQELKLHTFMPFSKFSCGSTKPTFVNSYRDGKFLYEARGLFPEKMKNLHGCPIRVSVSNESKPFVSVTYFPNGTQTLKGSEITNLEALADTLNFELNYTGIGGEQFMYNNGSLKSGSLKYMHDDLADMSAAQWWLSFPRLQYFDSTISYYSESAVFSIPPGHELSSVQKLVYPFSLTVWILIVLVFLIGYLVIKFVNSKEQNVQTLVYGENVRHPVLNLVVGFMGGSQTKIPQNSFARQLLMIFLLYSLVIRTLYLGSFVQFLSLSIRHQEVQSIDEMIDQKFTFYFEEGYSQFFKIPDAMVTRTVFVPPAKLAEIELRQRSEYLKGATGRSYEKTLYLNKINAKDQQIRMCKEAFLMNPVVIYTRRNFFLLNALNKKIAIFLAAGLIDYWHFSDFNYHHDNTETINYPQKLTMENLEGSFLILGLGYGISFFVFVVERMWLQSSV